MEYIAFITFPLKDAHHLIVIAPNASYSALLHEYTHYLDDVAVGFLAWSIIFKLLIELRWSFMSICRK